MSYPEESLYWKGRGMVSSQSEPVVSSNGQGEAAVPEPLSMVQHVAVAILVRRWEHQGGRFATHIEQDIDLAVAAIEAIREPLWERLKELCCADPENALRIVMLGREQFAAALRPSSGATAPRTATTAD